MEHRKEINTGELLHMSLTANIPAEYLRPHEDFGFSTVDEGELKVVVDENTLETEVIRESISHSSESLIRVEAKLDQILKLYSNGKLGLDAERTQMQTEVKAKLVQLEQMIMPLLVNLMKNPEKEYIYWPNRTEKLQDQINKVLALTRG
jgi:hypothetical protein